MRAFPSSCDWPLPELCVATAWADMLKRMRAKVTTNWMKERKRPKEREGHVKREWPRVKITRPLRRRTYGTLLLESLPTTPFSAWRLRSRLDVAVVRRHRFPVVSKKAPPAPRNAIKEVCLRSVLCGCNYYGILFSWQAESPLNRESKCDRNTRSKQKAWSALIAFNLQIHLLLLRRVSLPRTGRIDNYISL